MGNIEAFASLSDTYRFIEKYASELATVQWTFTNEQIVEKIGFKSTQIGFSASFYS